MGVIEKIKGWFSKKSPPLDIPSSGVGNLVGLYVPKYDDIKKISNKVNEIQDVIDNLPPPTPTPDLSDYARLSQVNTFKRAQIIQETNPYINLMNQNGVSVGILGKSKSGNNDVDLESKFGSANVKAAHQVILSAGRNYGVVMNGEIKQNNHVVNKEYVDKAIAKIPPVDLSNYYNKSEVDNRDTTTLNDAKSYTDSEIAKIPTSGGKIETITFDSDNNSISIFKKHILSGWYKYLVNSAINIHIPTSFKSKKFIVVCLIRILSSGNHSFQPNQFGIYLTTRDSLNRFLIFPDIELFSEEDLNPGASGNFNGEVSYKFTLIGVE